ncbi:MAG: hypothetical protein IPP14_01060 [Planctomycetes bacterium]|nr:hypothetical protein [Planctomycetota bacterium]
MTDRFDDRLLDRELQEALGSDAPSPELHARLLKAVGAAPVAAVRVVPLRAPGRRITAPVPRRSRAFAWVAAAAAMVVAAVVFGVAVLPSLLQTPSFGPAQADDAAGASYQPAGTPSESGRTQSPTRDPKQPPINKTASNDPSRGESDLPGPTPRQAPGPEPLHKPPQETPPKPEALPEVPEPEVPKHGVIEKPQPDTTSPDNTSQPPKPVAPVVLGTMVNAERVKSRLAEGEPWQDFGGGDLAAGMQLKATKAASFRLSNGATGSFEGEVAIRLTGEFTELALLARRSEFMLDNAGCAQPCIISGGQGSCSATGVLHAQLDGAALSVACFEGNARVGSFSLSAMQRVRINKKGAGKPTAIKATEARPQIVQDAPARYWLEVTLTTKAASPRQPATTPKSSPRWARSRPLPAPH